jgi:hypothetical protein
MQHKTLDKYVRAGLWALPIYGLANLVGTLSSQPDYHHNFPAYARYIHTPGFLASHLGASILGTGIGLLGFTALFIYLASRRAPGVSVAAYVTTILGNMAAVAVIGVAAFAQPAIGKAFLAGHHDAIALNSSVYGTALNLTVAVGLMLFFAGTVLFRNRDLTIALAAPERRDPPRRMAPDLRDRKHHRHRIGNNRRASADRHYDLDRTQRRDVRRTPINRRDW